MSEYFDISDCIKNDSDLLNHAMCGLCDKIIADDTQDMVCIAHGCKIIVHNACILHLEKK